MPNCTDTVYEFPPLGRRRIEAEFSGGDVSSDGGVLLLREMDRRLNLTELLDQSLADPRNPLLVVHSQLSLLRQRIYAIAVARQSG